MERKNINAEELEMTGAFVAFHNSWKGAAWKGDLQKKFDEVLGKDNIILSTVKLQDNAADVLYHNPEINRLFAGLLDSYDDLPYRPDTSFDFCWRAFEILMSMFSGHFNWQPKEFMGKKVADVCSLINDCFPANSKMASTIETLNKKCSLVGIRFMLQRLVDTDNLPEPDDMTEPKDTLIISNQLKNVISRVKYVTGDEFYDNFCKKYYKQKDISEDPRNHKWINIDIEAERIFKAAQVIKKFFVTGFRFDLKTNAPDGVNISDSTYEYSTVKVMELIISGILYTSRCYRFHGDYFSPFKSNRSSLSHYYEYYYFLIYTYAMFWYLLYCYLDIEGIDKFFTIDAVNDCVERCLKNLDKLPNE